MDSLTQQVLEANESHKNVLDQYTSKLQAELDAMDKLIAAVEDLPEDGLQEDPDDKWCLHADGAFKPIGIIDLTETVDKKSPFHEEAARRERYMKAVTPSPFSASEKRYLEKAIVKENKRLVAIRAQQSGGNAFEAVACDNEFFLENTEDIDWASVARDASSNYPLGSRTAQECKVRWLGAQHPKINIASWSEDDDKRLHDLVESKRESGLDWEEIAKLLDNNRTPLDCIKRFKGSSRPPFRWSSVLDQRLLDAVQKHGSSNWSLVASSVSPEVSANQCQIRYGRSINPEIKRGKFTPEEDELLMKAIEAHGSDWVKVAQAVPGRTNTQCRERYTIHLTGGIVKAPWDHEEDNKLRAAVVKHGDRWDKVREEMECGRSRRQYATRYKILARWDAQGEGASVGGTAASQSNAGTNDGLASEPDVPPAAYSTTAPVHESAGEDPGPDGEPSQPIEASASSAGIGPVSTSKGKGSKRGRKRKPPDALPEPETGDDAAQGDNSNNSAPRKRPRPKPRPRGAMAPTRQSKAGAGAAEGVSSVRGPAASATGDNAEQSSQVGPALNESEQPETYTEKPTNTSQSNLPVDKPVFPSTMDIAMADLSDLTELEDMPAPKKARTRAEVMKPVADRSPSRTRKPRASSSGKAAAPKPKPTPTHTMATRSSKRIVK